ncbi:hypothetical protein GCM10028807_33130 [Spirosoma daeguense]
MLKAVTIIKNMSILRYVVLALALILWAGGISSTVSHWLYDAGIIADDYRFGDLYRLSPLPQFKQAPTNCSSENRSSDTASTQLYIIGDSFTEPQRLGKNDFRVSHYQRVAWDFQQRAQLNSTKRNILLIESVERHFREHFARPITELAVQNDTTQNPKPQLPLRQRISNEFHRSDVEERLESTLFSHNWAFWFKELKALMTLNWFGRDNGSVTLSTDQQHVFLNLDTDTTKLLNSSFSPLTDQEVNTLVDSANAVADRYRQLGFDEVYISLIPNKTSILEPNRGNYNHLIERIQANSRLKVPYIDTYSAFKNAPSSPYMISDTHWNCEGRAIWLRQVRQKLRL